MYLSTDVVGSFISYDLSSARIVLTAKLVWSRWWWTVSIRNYRSIITNLCLFIAINRHCGWKFSVNEVYLWFIVSRILLSGCVHRCTWRLIRTPALDPVSCWRFIFDCLYFIEFFLFLFGSSSKLTFVTLTIFVYLKWKMESLIEYTTWIGPLLCTFYT